MAMPNLLLRLFAEDLDGYQPNIVDVEQPIKIIGMTVDTTVNRIYRDVPALGIKLAEYKKIHPLPAKKDPWGFAAVSKGFDKATGAFSYILGDVVTSLEKIPAGLISFEIPAIRYAVFPVRPKNRLGWGLAIANVKRYAYNTWLPQSGYEPAGVIDDFEYHDERGVRKSRPEIDLYIAIREKGAV
jgi:predicted transcriptional regulator YdeE